MTALEELKASLAEIEDLSASLGLLHWDQATHLPPRAAAARGRQLATLTGVLHQRRVEPRLGDLLDRCEASSDALDPGGDDASLLRVARRDFERARCLPGTFQATFARHRSEAYEAWARARDDDDFSSVIEPLERTLEMSLELSALLARGGSQSGSGHVADPLIDRSDRGMGVEALRALFGSLRDLLLPLVEQVAELPPPDVSCLRQHFDEDAQLRFGRTVVEKMGYDFQRGRQDRTRHPFMARFSGDDVRITTRVRSDDLGEALFSTIHEAGHALYELGIAPELDRSPLGHGVSSGVHESQSRLWENLVGRSRAFWQCWFPRLQEEFPQLGDTGADAFYRAINRVERSLIRTDADELTYNLHVMIRFDLELEMLEGRLAVRDLREAWNERYRSDLGVVPECDADGVLQDVHWFAGVIGGQFQGYAIGNVLSAQLYAAAVSQEPEIVAELGRGEFARLRCWLGEKVHRHGAKLEVEELIAQATGSPLSVDAYGSYLRAKFGELYSLDAPR